MDGIRTDRRADWLRIVLIIAASAAIRFWLLAHTEVTARDSIGFMREAMQFGERPWGEVFRSFQQMPGYPILIWAISQPVRAIAGTSCDSIVFSAQLVSILASLLTIVPIYFTGKLLFNRNAGLIAAAMFQLLPVCVAVTSDGLSEGAFFLFIAGGIYFGAAGLRLGSSWRFLPAGLCSGLAYFIRPEGLELAVCVGGVILATGLATRKLRLPARQFAALILGVLPVVACYVGITGELTRKPTSKKMLGTEAVQALLPTTSPMPFATFLSDPAQSGKTRWLWSAKSLFRETARSSHYFGLFWAAIGIWLMRREIRNDPAKWLLLALAGFHALILWRMAIVSGYLSERHTMMLALLACFWAGAAAIRVGEWLLEIYDRRSLNAASTPPFPPRFGGGRGGLRPANFIAVAAALIFIVAAGLPSILKPLHGNRVGHRQAGNWLAKHATGEDEVIDPFCWAHFYAGCVFREGKDFIPPQHTRYVVVEQSGNSHSRLMMIEEARQLAKTGTPVYHWPESKPIEQAKVVVYRVPARGETVARN